MNNKLFQPKIIFIFLFVLLFNSVIVLSEYNYYSDQQFYESTVGYFNELNPFEMDRVSIKPIYSPYLNVPLISDLNGDGLNEILLIEENILLIYKDKTLEKIADFLLADTNYKIIITSLNNSNEKEIIAYHNQFGSHGVSWESTLPIYILKFNGTNIYNISIINGLSYSQVGCDSVEKNCIALRCYLDYKTMKVSGVAFNLTHTSTDTDSATIYTSTTTAHHCGNPEKTFLASYDLKNSGKNQYVSNFIVSENAPAPMPVRAGFITTNVAKNLSVYNNYMNPLIVDMVGDVTQFPSVNSYKRITSPLILDFDGIKSNGLELVFGNMVSTTTFRLYSYKQVGNVWTLISQYPSVFTSDGIMLSNPIKADAFADTGVNDVCVLGFKTADSLLTLLCASEKTSTFYRSYEWDYKVNYNLSFVNPYIFSVYSGQHISEQVRDNRFTFGHQYFNPTEFVTPYGVFKLTMNQDLFFDWIYDLELIWENPFQNTMLFATDYLNKNRVDLIGLSDTNLYYIDDGFTTSGAVISQQYFNPCLDVTWRVNTTLEVRFRVSDIDNDLVSARAVLYEDTLFEQDSGWSNNLSSGTTFNFNFDVNTTISNGILSIYGRDTSNPLEIDSYSYPISVAGHYGAVFGECYTYIEGSEFGDIEFIEDTVAIDKELDKSDNIIRNIIVDINGAYDLGLGTTLIWLIITLCVVGGIFLSITGAKNHLPMGASMGVIILCFSLMMVIGTYLGFIGAGLLVVMVIVALIVLSVVYGKMFFGQSGGN